MDFLLAYDLNRQYTTVWEADGGEDLDLAVGLRIDATGALLILGNREAEMDCYYVPTRCSLHTVYVLMRAVK